MTLSTFDWTIVGAYFALSLAVGLWAARQAGKSTTDFFFSGAQHALVAFGCLHGSHYLFY